LSVHGLKATPFRLGCGERQTESGTLKLPCITRMLLRKRLKQPRQILLPNTVPMSRISRQRLASVARYKPARHASPLCKLEGIVQQDSSGLESGNIRRRLWRRPACRDGTGQCDTLALGYDSEVRQQILRWCGSVASRRGGFPPRNLSGFHRFCSASCSPIQVGIPNYYVGRRSNL
jgi:hypothetical protein